VFSVVENIIPCEVISSTRFVIKLQHRQKKAEMVTERHISPPPVPTLPTAQPINRGATNIDGSPPYDQGRSSKGPASSIGAFTCVPASLGPGPLFHPRRDNSDLRAALTCSRRYPKGGQHTTINKRIARGERNRILRSIEWSGGGGGDIERRYESS
jgi:hypothetical protein